MSRPFRRYTIEGESLTSAEIVRRAREATPSLSVKTVIGRLAKGKRSWRALAEPLVSFTEAATRSGWREFRMFQRRETPVIVPFPRRR